ncbi:MAG: hypothetical protein OWQ51_00140 [Pyrobaculum arsenaticum]|uniref:DNA-binding protein n=2 Tax=Pyrobaculum arsenaticum TaxID=121277 RepID=A4WNC3_PYRAR|nr:hypothetical protein [Pyrobaculum arsenaticum]ABP51890.1 conserved hypothetical protein [Pyrobaculum arsenaticum DSM 13514]MCY0889382.1 hypothetical protein [Pyrobaculum arsenaticum]NYR15580.1 hypothetical protein [Pyrobaculum arsenaticum]
MMLTAVGNIIDMLLRRQESITSDDVKALLKRANINISDTDLVKILITLEIYKKIYVKKAKKEGRDVFQISRRR